MGLCVNLHTTSGGIKTFPVYKTNRSMRYQSRSRFIVGSLMRYL